MERVQGSWRSSSRDGAPRQQLTHRQHEDRAEDDHPHEGSISVHLTTFSHHHSFRPYDSDLTPWYFGLPNFRLGGT